MHSPNTALPCPCAACNDNRPECSVCGDECSGDMYACAACDEFRLCPACSATHTYCPACKDAVDRYDYYWPGWPPEMIP